MQNEEIKRYATLNTLATSDGIVLFGGTSDKEIPCSELREAFTIKNAIYNRSLTDLSVFQAVDVFDACIYGLDPETVLLHIGAADIRIFAENPQRFDEAYRDLIRHIRSQCPKCRIAVVSFDEEELHFEKVGELNKHLRYIADSERCEFGDIAKKRVWNPGSTRDLSSFIYSIGFASPLKNSRPIYDLTKILFGYKTCLE